jgi:hypothetical protein
MFINLKLAEGYWAEYLKYKYNSIGEGMRRPARMDKRVSKDLGLLCGHIGDAISWRRPGGKQQFERYLGVESGGGSYLRAD